MKIWSLVFWVLALVLALALWFARSGTSRASPGPLSAAHAQDPELDEQRCEMCHGADVRDAAQLARACEQCHADIGQAIAQRTGLHGRLRRDATRCGACHSEHHGAQFQLVSAQASFLRAGIDRIANYDHAGLDFRLGGRHLALACAQCHENADAPVLLKGKRRYLGESQRCASCHADRHDGRLPDCKSCHGEERAFREAPHFAHTAQFPLRDAHEGALCSRCHEKSGATSIEAEAARAGKRTVRACGICHESPHGTVFLAAALAELGLERERSCVRCHPLGAKSFARPAVSFEKAWHAFSGFVLVAPHDQLACRDCHKDGLSYKDAHPGRTSEQCEACHAEPRSSR